MAPKHGISYLKSEFLDQLLTNEVHIAHDYLERFRAVIKLERVHINRPFDATIQNEFESLV